MDVGVELWRKLTAKELMLSGISLEGMMLKLKLQYFGHLMRRGDSLEETLMLGGIGAGGEGDDRGWDGWMASLTRWTWVWVNSGSWWWTGRSGVLRFMGSQRVGHDWVTELNWMDRGVFPGGSVGKELTCSAGNQGSTPGLGRSLGEGDGYPPQYAWLGNPADVGAWQATVHGVTKNWIQQWLNNHLQWIEAGRIWRCMLEKVYIAMNGPLKVVWVRAQKKVRV